MNGSLHDNLIIKLGCYFCGSFAVYALMHELRCKKSVKQEDETEK